MRIGSDVKIGTVVTSDSEWYNRRDEKPIMVEQRPHSSCSESFTGFSADFSTGYRPYSWDQALDCCKYANRLQVSSSKFLGDSVFL